MHPIPNFVFNSGLHNHVKCALKQHFFPPQLGDETSKEGAKVCRLTNPELFHL